MAVRVKFREVEAGTATPPLQQTPSNLSGNVAALQVATVNSSRHSVESELLGSRPRYVRHNTSSGLFFYCVVQLVGLGAIFYSLFRRHPDHIGEIVLNVSLLLAVFTGVFGFLYWDNRRIRNLLQNADAYVATVITVEKGVHYYRVHSVYMSKEGQTIETVVQVHPDIVVSENLAPQASFTLLVSPDNPKQLMPYFLATRTFSVVPVDATHVSSEVSARIAARTASLPAQSGGRLGVIEPELMGVTPRPLRMTSAYRRAISWFYAAVAAFMTFFVVAPKFGLHITPFLQWQFLFQILIQCVLAPMLRKENTNDLLRKGIPTRAVVSAEEDMSGDPATALAKQKVSFSYQYEHDGKVHTKSIEILRRRAWQLGLVEGATFTVLYDPKNASVATPYFQISHFEIVGAMGAKITPP